MSSHPAPSDPPPEPAVSGEARALSEPALPSDPPPEPAPSDDDSTPPEPAPSDDAPPPHRTWRAAAWPELVAVVVTAGAVWLAVPGLGPLDAGDFVAAVASAGVPHPTGFGAWMLGAILSVALPVASLASGVAWTSAFFAAVTAAALVALLAATGPRGATSSIRMGLLCTQILVALFLFAPVALQARMPEVYLLQTALLFAALGTLHVARASDDLRWLGPLGLLVGLGIANHALFRLFGPMLLLGVVWIFREHRTRAAGWTGLGVLLGSCAWMWLPAAAASDPAHNWGDPSSLARFVDVARASTIREAFGDRMFPSHPWVLRYAGDLVTSLHRTWGALLFLAPIGCWALVRTRDPVLRLLVLAGVVDFGYAVLINPMGLRDAQNGQVLGLVAAVGIGEALARVVALVHAHAERGWTAVATAAALTGASPLLSAGQDPRLRIATDHHPDDLVAIVAGYTSPGAVVSPVSDTPSAALLVGDVVLDARPDAVWVGRWVLSDRVQMAQWCRHHDACPFDPAALAEVPRDRVLGLAVEQLLAWVRAERVAMHFEVSPGLRDLPTAVGVVEQWPWGAVGPASGSLLCGQSPFAFCDDAPDVRFGAAARASSLESVWYRRFLASRHGQRAALLLAAGQLDSARAAFERAEALSDRPAPWAAGVALAHARACSLDEALAWTDRAVDDDPGLRNALRNGLLFAEAHGDVARAWRYQTLAQRYGVDVEGAADDAEAVRSHCAATR